MADSEIGSSSGPIKSRQNKRTKQQQKPLVRSSKLRKLTEKQKIQALENDALNYVAPEDLKTFADLPISESTKRGLKKAFFVNLTDIQAKSLPVSLKGKDVLGAARTGSGKTLAFLIPTLEILYRRKWGPSDGLGALIISPTRELAVQIFDVLRAIGGYHSFSAGLVIGGKNLKDERDRLSRMNILVATPGRLLQHMDQTVGFDVDNLQLLILDEADRILDMGFQRTLSALLAHLPKSRQTLLFSATQTDSVSDLARLSLKDPEYVGVQELGASNPSIPQNLEQHYVICDLDKKLDILWGFIKTHLQAKILVFLSSCKQVRFVFETFCKMHPGVPLLHLHGKQKQSARLAMYTKFTSMSHAVLFATDIAARGLDFPSIDWVVQLDTPEDAETYIHRVGRTARYESKGKALLVLLPSEEEGMKAALQKKGIEVHKIKIKSSKAQSIENQLQNLSFQDPEIKYLGQRAFVSYLRSIYLHKDKAIFKLEELPVERFAESLGLPGAPKIKFYSKEIAKKKKNASRAVEAAQADVLEEKQKRINSALSEESTDDSSDENNSSEEDEVEQNQVQISKDTDKNSKASVVRTKYDRMFERKNQNILSEHYSKLIDKEQVDDEDDDFITLKRADHDLPGSNNPLDPGDLSKRKLKLGKAKRTVAKGGLPKKLVFDDEGKPHEMYELEDAESWFNEKGGLAGAKEEGQKFARDEEAKMKIADLVDKEEAKEKKKEKKRKRKAREREAFADEAPILNPSETYDDGYISPEFDLPDLSSDDEENTSFVAKKRRKEPTQIKSKRSDHEPTLEDQEDLALQLLRSRR